MTDRQTSADVPQDASVVVPGLVRRDSGLLVPSTFASRLGAAGSRFLTVPPSALPERTLFVAGEPPSDLDSMFVAPDPEALGRGTPSLEAICALLGEVPVEPAVFGLSGLAAAAWHAGTDQA